MRYPKVALQIKGLPVELVDLCTFEVFVKNR